MSDTSNVFSEYIRSRENTNIGFRPTFTPGAASSSSGNKRGWLATVVDFLNIGVYPGTTLANSLLDLPEKTDAIKDKMASGDTAGAIGDSLAAAGSVLSAPIRGISTPFRRAFGGELAADEGQTFEAVLEKGTDVANRNNPNYVDTDNNVNTWAKGGVGLALDIAADPLTYLSFGTLGAAKIAARGAAKVADDVVEAANKVPTPAEAAPLNVPRAPRATKKPAVPTSARPNSKAAPGNVENFPASSVTETIGKSIANDPLNAKRIEDSVNETLLKTIDSKMVDLPGIGKTGLSSGLKVFFNRMKQAPGPATITSKIASNIGSFMRLLEKDVAEFGGVVRLEEAIPGYTPARIEGAANNQIMPTVAGALEQYQKIKNVGTPTAAALRQAIEERVIGPLMARYNGAVKAGNNITAFGTPRTAADAVQQTTKMSAAEIVANNLRTISEGNKAIGVALMGEDLFKIISDMPANDLGKVLDSIGVLMRADGVSKDVYPLLQGEISSKFLQLFDIDNAVYSAAKLDVADRLQSVVDGRVAPDLENAIKAVDESPAVLEDAADNLALFGMTPVNYKFLEVPGTTENVFETVMDGVESGADAARINFDEKLLKKRGYMYQTDEGAPRTEDIYGEGFGVLKNRLSTYGQMNYMMASASSIVDKLNALPFYAALKNKGFAPISAKESMVLASWKTLENFFEARGVPILMDLKVAESGAHVTRNLKFTQVYDVLARNLKQTMRIAVFKAGTGVAYTKIMDAVMTGIVTGDRAEVLKVLRSTEARYGKKTPPNWFATPNATATVGKAVFKSGDLSEQVADEIIKNIDVFEDLAAINATKLRARGMAEAEAISATAADIVVKMLKDPTKVAQSGITVAKSGRLVGDIIEELGDVTDLGAVLGNARVLLGLGKNFKSSAETQVALAEAVAKREPKAVTASQDASYKQVEETVDTIQKTSQEGVQDVLEGRAQLADPSSQKLVDEVVGESVDNAVDGMRAVASKAYATQKASLAKGFNFLNSFFNVNKGMHVEQKLYIKQMFSGVENIHHRLANEMFLPIAQLGKKYAGYADAAKSTTIMQAAYNAIRQGVKATGVVGKAQEKLTPFVAKFFGLDNNPETALLGNAFLRGGGSLARLNEIFTRYDVLGTTAQTSRRGPDEYFDLNKVVEDLGPKATDEDIMNALASQWKSWDVQDPILFLDRLTRALSQAVGEVSYVTGLRNTSIDLGLASLTPKKGFIKVSAEDDFTLAQHIQGEFYMDPEAAEAFRNVSDFADEIARIGSSKMERTIDEFTDAFKYAATQARLGHHVRNFFGGVSMTGIGMGINNFRKAFVESARIRSMLQQTDELDLLKILENLGEPMRTTVRNADEAARVVHSTKNGKVTAGEIADAINRYGINPPVSTAEAFASTGAAQGGVAKFMQKFLSFASLTLAARGGRMEKMWSRLSQEQDHLNRDHMFIQYVMQALDGKKMPRGFGKRMAFDFSKPDVMEDIYTFAAERVAKYHPSIQGLTALERRIPRRFFPFYAWNKGAVIALSEAIVMYPSRVSWPFKASYNLGVATGVDPNSFYDPFPTDQRFPSYMTEDINGPQFVVNDKYYGFQPGLAQFDILNQFAASDSAIDPVYMAAIDSLNPGIKLPIELITGSRMRSRNPIPDISDYVDSSIPTVSYISNLTTYSPSSFLIDGELQKNRKYEAGDKTDLSRILSLANWATGAGIYEASRPDLINLARIQEQIKRAEEREANQ